ncbi:MAG: PAS domain S-box protein [Phycisphaeraceae bacterium]|nr:PAS domain S-box protein [Phycisphaeraceae bacterium]
MNELVAPDNFGSECEAMADNASLAAIIAALGAATGSPISGISFQVGDRIWSGPVSGWSGGWRESAGSLCAEVINHFGVLAEASLLNSSRASDRRLTGEVGARSYLGVPVRIEGFGVAAVFVADTRLRAWTPGEIGTVQRIAGLTPAACSARSVRSTVDAHPPLLEAQELIRCASSLAKVGSWSLDAMTGKVQWSKEVKEIHEVPPDFEPNSLSTAVSFYPDDAEKTIRSLVERAIEHGEGYEAELPFVTAKGRRLWVRTIGNCVMENGRCAGLRGVFQDITSRKLTEDRYRLLAEATDDLVTLADRDGRPLYISPSTERVLGWDADQLGQASWTSILHPADADRFEQAQRRALQGDRANTRCRTITKDGRLIWLDVRGSPVRNASGDVEQVVWTSRDASSQVFVEEWQRERIGFLEMLLSGASLQEIFDRLILSIEGLRPGTRASILLTELRDGKLVLRDAAGPSLPAEYRTLVDGLPTGPNVGSCGAAVHNRRRVISVDLLTDPNWEPPREIVRALNLRSCWSEPFFASDSTVLGTFATYGSVPGAPNEAELHLISEAAKLCAIAIERRKSEEAVRAALTDLAATKTSLEHRSEELQRKNADLAAAISESERLRRQAELDSIVAQELRRRADEANRAKSDFLANMSHEIRTPMTSILGFADLLSDAQGAPENSAEFVRAIHRNAEHLLSVINDILDISKIEAGRVSVERIECSPATIIHDVASLMTGRAAQKGIGLEFSFAESVPPTVVTDPTRLRQIAINLVGNAIKFTDQGRVRVHLEYEPDAMLRPLGVLILKVQDSGIGLTADQLSGLFQAFSQADPSTSRKFGGSGLGLAISRRLARLLGGDISATSTPGSGSEFVVRLNCRLVEGSRAGIPEATSSDLPSTNRIQGRILLAEDGPDNQRLIVHLLRQAGAEVVTVTNGSLAFDQCFEQLRAGQPFDLILMDMQMPIKDGYETTRAIRANGYTGPIVALTANVLTEQRRRAMESGCNDVIEKPIERHRFLSVCRDWIAAGAKGPNPAAV